VIKVAGSAGLLVGMRFPRLGATTSKSLIAYYAAAVGYHRRAEEHPILALPAALFGAAAALTLVAVYLPGIRRSGRES
jgi:hypothetical protein